MEHVAKDADLQEQLGPPVRVGRWYNAAIGVRPGGMAADCGTQLSGTQHDANATIQVCLVPMQVDDGQEAHSHLGVTRPLTGLSRWQRLQCRWLQMMRN